MKTIGAFEAKTHLSSLLDQVARGEEVLITKRGVPVARLVPAKTAEKSDVLAAIHKLKALRKTITLQGLSWKKLRDEGRR